MKLRISREPEVIVNVCEVHLFYKNNFLRTRDWDFAQSWGKIKNNLKTSEAETLKICQKKLRNWKNWRKIKNQLRTFEAEILKNWPKI